LNKHKKKTWWKRMFVKPQSVLHLLDSGLTHKFDLEKKKKKEAWKKREKSLHSRRRKKQRIKLCGIEVVWDTTANINDTPSPLKPLDLNGLTSYFNTTQLSIKHNLRHKFLLRKYSKLHSSVLYTYYKEYII
jgi:hypothetical protein